MKVRLKALMLSFYCYFAIGVSDVLAAKSSSYDDPHHAEGASVGLPQLDVTTYPSQLFWLAVFFVFLYSVTPAINLWHRDVMKRWNVTNLSKVPRNLMQTF